MLQFLGARQDAAGLCRDSKDALLKDDFWLTFGDSRRCHFICIILIRHVPYFVNLGHQVVLLL